MKYHIPKEQLVFSSERNLARHLGVMIPKDPSAATLADHGVFIIHETVRPEIRSNQVCELSGVTHENGVSFRSWNVRKKTREEIKTERAARERSVKREANRRIVSVYPEWKQRNLLADAAVLTDKGRDNWTRDELAVWESVVKMRADIAAIRSASDRIEAMKEIPADVTSDTLWIKRGS